MVCHSGNAHASLDFMGDEAFLAVRQQGKAQSDPTEFRYHRLEKPGFVRKVFTERHLS
jgi:hypothetical protein